MKVHEYVKELQSYDQDKIIFLSEWSVPDLQEYIKCPSCGDKQVILTDDQYEEIFKLLERNHDAEIGINWDTIEYWCREFINNSSDEDKEKMLCKECLTEEKDND